MANHTITTRETQAHDGVVLNALAFSTLLSSQGTDAHLWFTVF